MLRKSIFILALVLTGVPGWAQFGFNAGTRSDLVANQRYNPAYLMEGEFQTFRFSSSFEFWVGNSDAALKGIFGDQNGYISQETKDRLIGDMNGAVTLAGGYHFDLVNANFALGNVRLGVNISDQFMAGGKISNPLTAGLLLNGNGPYAGDTITDDGLSGGLLHTRELGIAAATENSDGSLKFGGRLSFLLGQKAANVKNTRYSLFTGVDGTELNITSDYYLSRTHALANQPLIDPQGFGVSADLGMTMELNESMKLHASLLNIGFTSWDMKNYENSVDVNFDGISITSLFADSIPEQIQDEVDSLTNLLLPDSTLRREMMVTPFTVRIGMDYALGEKGKLTGMIMYCPVSYGPRTSFPLIAVGYTHEVVEGLKLSGSLSGGGVSTLGVGAMASYRMALSGDQMAIDLFLGGDNLIGFTVPGIGRGMSLMGGIGFSY